MVKQFLQDHLLDNEMIIVYQDTFNTVKLKATGDIHFFCMVGDTKNTVHIIEHLGNKCNDWKDNNYETFNFALALNIISSITDGLIPDRFYHNTSQHIIRLTSYTRRSLSVETVRNYLDANS